MTLALCCRCPGTVNPRSETWTDRLPLSIANASRNTLRRPGAHVEVCGDDAHAGAPRPRCSSKRETRMDTTFPATHSDMVSSSAAAALAMLPALARWSNNCALSSQDRQVRRCTRLGARLARSVGCDFSRIGYRLPGFVGSIKTGPGLVTCRSSSRRPSASSSPKTTPFICVSCRSRSRIAISFASSP